SQETRDQTVTMNGENRRFPGLLAGRFPCLGRGEPISSRSNLSFPPATWTLMIRLLDFIDWLLGLYVFILIVTAIMSWLVAFNVINVRNDLVRQILYTLELLTEPALRPIRRFVPPLGGLDLSFLLLFILIQLVRSVIIPDLMDLFI